MSRPIVVTVERAGGEGREMYRPILCRRVGCDQMLAREGVRGDVYPVVVGAYIDQDGRMCVTCPLCGERNRLPVRRVG